MGTKKSTLAQRHLFRATVKARTLKRQADVGERNQGFAKGVLSAAKAIAADVKALELEKPAELDS